MELPSTLQFKGWDIQYNIFKSHGARDGPASCLVFVHGTPWSSIVFRPVAEALLETGRYHILLYDLPGYGQSQAFNPHDSTAVASRCGFPGDTSVKFQAEALAALLERVGWHGKADGSRRPAPAVVAHDIAGTIVLRAHLLHGCEFDSMMLCDANAVLPWGDGFYTLARSEPQPFVKLPTGIFEAVVRAVIRSACHDPRVLQTGWEDALARPWLDDPSGDGEPGERQRSFIRQIAQANDGDVQEMLSANMYRDVRCDVKIVWGEQDQWIPKDKIEQFIGLTKGKVKQEAVIPDAGHLVMLDQPTRFAIELLEWLTRFSSGN